MLEPSVNGLALQTPQARLHFMPSKEAVIPVLQAGMP